MKTIKFCFIFILTATLFSCKKEPGTVVDTNVEFNVVNAQGQDLLNSVYTKNNITVTHIINGQPVPPSQEITIHQEALHVLTIFDKGPNEPNITLIQFGTSKPDTLRKELLIRDNNVYCTKVWINGELKFDDSKQTNLIARRFTLIK